mmetsp:Transcript_37130/g.106967  ORF Transcript_37130/g.106967 Transcript_37130/m.106967 type:complete len:248 (+) Transcript_37130:528-1271(+)
MAGTAGLADLGAPAASMAKELFCASRWMSTSAPMRCSIQAPTDVSGGRSLPLAALASGFWQIMERRISPPAACNSERINSRNRCSSGSSLFLGSVSRNSCILASRAAFASSAAAIRASGVSSTPAGRNTLRSAPAPFPAPLSLPLSLPEPLPLLPTDAAASPISSATFAPRSSCDTRTSEPMRRSIQPSRGAPFGSTAARAKCTSFEYSPRVKVESFAEPPALDKASRIFSRKVSSSGKNSSVGKPM